MKKLVFITYLLICSMFAYTQTDSTKLTVKQVYEDAKTGITRVVNALGGPAKHVYSVYVRQHYVEGITAALRNVFLYALVIFLFAKFWKKADFRDEAPLSGTLSAVVCMVSTVAFIIITIGTICFFSDGFLKILNPEYYAIQDIIKAFK